MRNIIYGVCIILYVAGFVFLLDFLYEFQKASFNDSYYTLLYPIFALFILGIYVSFYKLFKKIIEPEIKIKFGNIKWLYVFTGIVGLLLLSFTVNFNPYNFIVWLAFIGYFVSLTSGFQFIKIVK